MLIYFGLVGTRTDNLSSKDAFSTPGSAILLVCDNTDGDFNDNDGGGGDDDEEDDDGDEDDSGDNGGNDSGASDIEIFVVVIIHDSDADDKDESEPVGINQKCIIRVIK